ncbi:diguanylate cyclase [Allochromatium palmeri]|uniref:Diguanylate cyclase n=2 Tax=Allochromatium palmeri TaxID=231048 RepID=A0A6N8EJQ4_9GAMM|nr:diguanylate cyclase [Allochromatium palmeri]
MWYGFLFVCTLAQAGEPAQALETVSLQLKWSHAFQFAGYYAALEQGYYRDAGLNVRLLEAGPGIDALESVLSGKAQYGVGTSSLLLARAAGQPVVVLAVVFQHSPLVLVARQDLATLGTQGIHDLVGKRVMIEPQSDELIAYLKQEGIGLDRLVQVPHSFEPQDLIAGQIDAMSAYVTNEPYYLEASGLSYQTYTPRSVGIDFYGDNLFTTEEELKHHPQRVRAFREASLRGWQYAMEHPEEIADLILAKYSKQHPRDFYLFEAERMVPLLRTDLIEVGYMNRGRWRHIAATYADLGLLPRNYVFDGFLYEPDSHPDLTRLYIALALLMLVSALALYIHRANRRLALALDAKSRSEERHRVIFQTTASAGVVWREGFIVTDWNRQAEALFGWRREEVLGRRFVEFLLPESERERLTPRFGHMVRENVLPQGVNDNLTRDGHVITCEWFNAWLPERPGEPREVVSLANDISERRRLEEEIRQLAFFDPLTRLPNRRLLFDRLGRVLATLRRDGGHGALLFLDLDNFKPLNDRYGHAVGDLLLVEVAQRLGECVRHMDTVARFGGDEFVVLLGNLDDDQALAQDHAKRIARKILDRVGEPYRLARADVETAIEHHCTASIGLALFDAAADEEDILRRADTAMYKAKGAGRNRIVVDSGSPGEALDRDAASHVDRRAHLNSGNGTK